MVDITDLDAGFKFTMNLGQVFQIASVVIPAIGFWTRFRDKHRVLETKVDQLFRNQEEIRESIKSVENSVRQIPSIVVATGRAESKHNAVLKSLADKENNVAPPMTPEMVEELFAFIRERKENAE